MYRFSTSRLYCLIGGKSDTNTKCEILIFVHVLVETPVRSFLFDPSGLVVVLWKRWLAKQVLPSYQTLMGPAHLLRLQFSFSDIADHNVAIQLPNRCLAQSFVNSECLSLRRRRLLVHYLLSVIVLLVLFNCLAICIYLTFGILDTNIGAQYIWCN